MSNITDNKPRCGWPGDDDLMLRYHDKEWGVPVHDDGTWFEYLLLDAFQAGPSWKTVLHKREAFREVFHDFDPEREIGRGSCRGRVENLGGAGVFKKKKIHS